MRRLVIAALLLGGACARPNPAFNADDGGEGANVSGEDTTDGPPAGSTSTGPIDPTVATSGTTSWTDTTTGTSDPSETSVVRDDVPRFICEAGPQCDAFETECEGDQTCRPFAEGDELVVTRCVPNGDARPGADCLPTCAAGPETACDGGLVCDRAGGEGACRFLCKGTLEQPICDEGGICFRQMTDGGSFFGVCEGECDPLEEGSCGEDACVMGFDEPVPVCVPHTGSIPVEGCADDPCPQGWACIPPGLANDCGGMTPCCFPLCEPFPLGVQCSQGTCVPFGELGGANVPLGFCDPP